MTKLEESDYKDKISTLEISGKRKWIYAIQPKGKLYTLRSYLSYFYLLILFAIPFISVNGEPLFLFNIPQGKFILFGKIFLPQDFALFGLAMLIFIIFIILFTLAYGRIFCGWMCPQTIFLEMVFRRIEYWIEGSANRQKIQDSKNWTTELYVRKAVKHIIFFAISFLISNIFLSYIIGIKDLLRIINEPVTDHVLGFASIIVFALVFYFVFAYVKEIVCTVVCPYGRLQSVLLDKNSIVVAYDYLRGEPRAKSSRNRDSTAGDCIDCDLCVQVCPTGIDIRNGTQMECTNCTACIDACNLMMKKSGGKPDLIKFASENNIKEGTPLKFNYRMGVYTIALVILMALFSFLILSRDLLDVTILRVPGQILQENADGTISNLYRMKVINKSSETLPFKIILPDSSMKLTYAGNTVDSIQRGAELELVFFIYRPASSITERKEIVNIKIDSRNKIIYSKKIPFIGRY
ncbi:MAG: cytochrome c oxidase accessory protein CcoG [Saprospiraceae bacterium]